MQWGQLIRRLGAQMRAGFAAFASASATRSAGVWWPPSRRVVQFAALALLGVVMLYYGAGALSQHKIDDNPDFTIDPKSLVQGESLAVSLAVGLLDREVNHNGWVANSPFYLPTALLHNMASYQTGIVEVIRQFAGTLDQALAARGVPSVDLEVTVQRLSKRPDVWSWAWSEPWGYLGNSEGEYREAWIDLQGYNVGLTDGSSHLPKEAPVLATLLERFSTALREASEALETEAAAHPLLLSRRLGDAFYRARGNAYCEMILLRGLRADFSAIIRERNMDAAWTATEDALLRAAVYSPLFVVNAAPDSLVLPSHPLVESYYVLAARRALEALLAKLR